MPFSVARYREDRLLLMPLHSMSSNNAFLVNFMGLRDAASLRIPLIIRLFGSTRRKDWPSHSLVGPLLRGFVFRRVRRCPPPCQSSSYISYRRRAGPTLFLTLQSAGT